MFRLFKLGPHAETEIPWWWHWHCIAYQEVVVDESPGLPRDDLGPLHDALAAATIRIRSGSSQIWTSDRRWGRECGGRNETNSCPSRSWLASSSQSVERASGSSCAAREGMCRHGAGWPVLRGGQRERTRAASGEPGGRGGGAEGSIPAKPSSMQISPTATRRVRFPLLSPPTKRLYEQRDADLGQGERRRRVNAYLGSLWTLTQIGSLVWVLRWTMIFSSKPTWTTYFHIWVPW
jgi:hypothetical protein